MKVHAVTWPDAVEIGRGETGFISVAVSNTSDVIDAYEVQVFGLDPEWLEISPQRLSLFPGDTENVDIRVTLPEEYPSSRRTLAVNVVSQDDPGSFTLSEVELSIRPMTVTTVALDPVMVTGGKGATFGIVVSNLGNAVVHATAFAIDPEDLSEFTFEPTSVFVAPGRDQVIQATARGGRAWFGQAKARTFTMGVDAEQRVETIATFIQRPRIGRWLISLLGLLTAAAVFAAVLSRTFDNIIDEAKVDDALIDDALNDGGAGGAIIPINPGGVVGSLISATTGNGLGGVQAELFDADDIIEPVAAGATSDDGNFSFVTLNEGEYKLRLSGAGIDTIWYPGAAAAADAGTIEVVLGESTELDPVVLGGIPVEVAGSIDVDNPTDVIVSLVVPGQVGGTSDAVVAEVQVSADGSFVFPDVPSPGVYQLVIEQPGVGLTTRDVVVQPGEDIGDIDVSLLPGKGAISGLINGPQGLLGGVTVTATSGTTVVDTVTLTVGDVGSFDLRNLPTPAQYTVTLERDGFTTEARTVALDETSNEGTVTATLVAATGEIRGNAVVEGLVERGLTVTISGGDVNRIKPIVSQGFNAGGYVFDALPAPGTYTLTFGGADVIPQVRIVDLDPRTGTALVTGINVSLSRETTVVQGRVFERDISGDLRPVPRATVTLSDGATVFTFPTAHEPAGAFEFGAVPPGSYTLSGSRIGTESAVIIVAVSPTQALEPFDLVLGAQASVVGRVVDLVGSPVTTPKVVRIFDPNRFPNAGALAEVTTDNLGEYVFSGLGAPESFVIAVYDSASSADPIDSVVVRTIPSREFPVPDLLGGTPP
ncbi:MAG: hypothetical protein ACJAXA_000766 [Candidatus Aldehydirespiratoraceae bacterium]